jgi:hypothetical protein
MGPNIGVPPSGGVADEVSACPPLWLCASSARAAPAKSQAASDTMPRVRRKKGGLRSGLIRRATYLGNHAKGKGDLHEPKAHEASAAIRAHGRRSTRTESPRGECCHSCARTAIYTNRKPTKRVLPFVRTDGDSAAVVSHRLRTRRGAAASPLPTGIPPGNVARHAAAPSLDSGLCWQPFRP